MRGWRAQTGSCLLQKRRYSRGSEKYIIFIPQGSKIISTSSSDKGLLELAKIHKNPQVIPDIDNVFLRYQGASLYVAYVSPPDLFCFLKHLFISFNCHWFLYVLRYMYCAKHGTVALIPWVPYLAHSEKLITSTVYCVAHVPFRPLAERQVDILYTYCKLVRIQYSTRNIRYTKDCQFFK